MKFRTSFPAAVIIALSAHLASAQIGVSSGPGHSVFSCTATAAGAPELRPEGYTELVGDILISCTGGPDSVAGVQIPTANIVVYLLPSVPITSRFLGAGGASEAMLMIDEPGSGLPTGATGGYGPQAPQTFCTTAQQQAVGGSSCAAFVGTAAGHNTNNVAVNYAVAVTAPGGAVPAQNVYQGKIGDFGPNSVVFYNVPVLTPADQGVTRIFRITNIRIPVPGGNLTSTLQAVISTSPNQVMPVAGTALDIGVVGPAMTANVNALPLGGFNPFNGCVPQTTPALASQVRFIEGFSTGFKTRAVPLANQPWASTVANDGTPGQNIPGSLYGNLANNNESGFILPAANATVAGVTYTAGLTDFGTRLKAVFTNIPPDVTLYVSTANSAGYAIPGGTNTAPYAVLVSTAQANEANNDGAVITPFTPIATGSDGAGVYPLAADSSGSAAAIWEVVNAEPFAIDTLSFGVYVSYTNSQGTVIPTNASLSFAPEPGGGTFSTVNATQGLTNPEPRFAVIKTQGGAWGSISSCPLSANTTPLGFSYTVGLSVPPGQTVSVSTSPGNLPVTVTPLVTTPSGGAWLSASLSSGTLTVSVHPAGLAASSTPYTGNVKLSAAGAPDVLIPVNLTVYVPSALSISEAHSGTFSQGQSGAAYTITVINGALAGATNGTVTVTAQTPSGLSLISMAGTGWDCSAMPSCSRNDVLLPGAQYSPITVIVDVAFSAASPQINSAGVSGGGSATAGTTDSTIINPVAPLRFVPVTPCRIADTRQNTAPFTGQFGGPKLAGGNSRAFSIPASSCVIPATAQAYSLNVAVIPQGLLGFLTMWPTGQPRPFASILNSLDGRIKSNTAIVPAGTGGAISVYVSDPSDVVLDITGYFVPATDPAALAFYPVAPCRIADTRNPAGPLGAPSLVGGQGRTFPVLSAACNVPATAQAYSLNLTAVPPGPLGFITAWPTGQTMPGASSLNALTGTIVANGAIIPAGTGGAIDIFAINDTNLVIDINGYFAPMAPGGLSLYNITTCRVLDTRQLAGAQPFTAQLDVSVSTGACGIPASAPAAVLSATVVPVGALGFLALWPQGQIRPTVSTLNALDAAITSNMAIVPTNNGSISSFASDLTQLILDISGYFGQ
jgi:hypothetical protein